MFDCFLSGVNEVVYDYLNILFLTGLMLTYVFRHIEHYYYSYNCKNQFSCTPDREIRCFCHRPMLWHDSSVVRVLARSARGLLFESLSAYM